MFCFYFYSESGPSIIFYLLSDLSMRPSAVRKLSYFIVYRDEDTATIYSGEKPSSIHKVTRFYPATPLSGRAHAWNFAEDFYALRWLILRARRVSGSVEAAPFFSSVCCSIYPLAAGARNLIVDRKNERKKSRYRHKNISHQSAIFIFFILYPLIEWKCVVPWFLVRSSFLHLNFSFGWGDGVW